MKICVFGAGSIGCYVGGRLAAAGADVMFIGRERIRAELAEHGLQLSDLTGEVVDVPPDAIRFTTDPAAAAEADIVLVTVKSTGTVAAGRTLAGTVRSDTTLVSLQNGVGNAAALLDLMPDCTVLPAVVEYNVVGSGAGRFRRATSGEVAVRYHRKVSPLAAAFAAAGMPLHEHTDLRPLQWAKLLLNLNNPVNALSGLPLRDELSRRGYRRCLALAQREALRAMHRSGIEPAALTPGGPALMTRVLPLPDPVFRRIAGRLLTVDPAARSSMADDLDAGRATEIDWLCGEIVVLGDLIGVPTPVNRRLLQLVHDAERGGRRIWPDEELLTELRAGPDPDRDRPGG